MKGLSGLVDATARSIWTTGLAVIGLAVLSVAVGMALGLSLAGSISLYFVVWWTVLFVILPVRVTSQAETGLIAAGTEPGAPASPALRERAIWTTMASLVVFAIVAIVFPLAGL